MVKVLVFGGAGYIGSATCLALRQAGHTVVGVSRQKSVAELEQNEVEVAQGDINDLKTLQSKIDEANVVIDNVLDSTKGFNANKDLLAAVEASAKKNGRKRYIYTSGCLVYGDNKGKILSETDALKQPMLKARTDHELPVKALMWTVWLFARVLCMAANRLRCQAGWSPIRKVNG